MELNKYYTPEIEELHVGFECELLDIEQGLFGKCTIKENDILSDELFRVRYLDKEDIESLGWIQYKEFNNHYRIGDNWVLHFRKDGDILYPIDLYCGRKEFPPGAYRSYMFISIKNKSELKKLMQQLRIDETQ